MKNLRKLLAFVAVFTLLLAMRVPAFAQDHTEVKIDKVLEVQGVNPAETFNFTVGEGSGLRDGVSIVAPAFNPAGFSIIVAQGETSGTTNIALPTFTQVGVYTYEVKETAGNTAGFEYDGNTYYLVVTVTNNPNFPGEGEPQFIRTLTLRNPEGTGDTELDVKEDDFSNEFESGNLVITKQVAGNYSDPNDEFTVVVTLTAVEGKTLNTAAIVADGGTIGTDSTGAYTITYTVKHGSTYTIQNIPYDVNYTVVESANDKDYVVSYDEFDDGEMNAASISTTITNTRNTTVNTGINLDNLPYIMILVVAAAGLVGYAVRRRRTDIH